MSSIAALFACAVLAGTPETVVLEFTNEQCPPCRTVEPAVQQLQREGFPIRQIDLARQLQLSQEYEIKQIPTFLVVVDGQPRQRLVGAHNYQRLRDWLLEAGVSPLQPAATESPTPAGDAAGLLMRGQSPDPGYRQPARNAMAAGPANAIAPGPAANTMAPGPAGNMAYGIPSQAAAAQPPTTLANPQQAASPQIIAEALQATVRLRVDDGNSLSYATGTIVDVHGNEALVLTCGHVFRDSQGRAPISVDLFAPGATNPVPGKLLDFDASHRDIGLVVIRPNVPVRAVRVAGDNYQTRPGERIFSIGCDQGADPSVRQSHVTSINRYTHAPITEIHGEPIDGRSGGGLFTADGRLIGVCNAADTAEDKGLYAALPTVHGQLVAVGLERLFKQPAPNLAAGQTSPPPVAAPPLANAPPPMTPRPLAPQPLPAPGPAPLPGSGLPPRNLDVRPAGNFGGLPGNAEVILITREPGGTGSSQVMVIQQPSSQLIQQLQYEAAQQNARQRVASQPQQGPLVRAQSSR